MSLCPQLIDQINVDLTPIKKPQPDAFIFGENHVENCCWIRRVCRPCFVCHF